MDTPDNYYAILGVPIDADDDTVKQAYRQLARRYHPDLAGPEGAIQMKRINRAYDVLSDPEKRLKYDTIIGGVIDLRNGAMTRPRPVQRRVNLTDDIEFSGLSRFSTKGPLHPGPSIQGGLGVVTALASVKGASSAASELCIAAGSLDGRGILWRVGSQSPSRSFAADSSLTVESLRELRFSSSGGLLAGWGRLGVHVWDTQDGSLLWSFSLGQRAVSAHYSLDVVLGEMQDGTQEAIMALPLLPYDPRAPRSRGVRGTDIVKHTMGTAVDALSDPIVCVEDEGKRQFWAIRLRALAQNAEALLTFSCAHVPGEKEELAIVRRWDVTLAERARGRLGGKVRPRVITSMVVGPCADCTPPYAVTPDAVTLACVYKGQKVRLYDIVAGTYSELASGTMGGNAKLTISPDGQWIAVAREDSEINEGVVDLWSTGLTGKSEIVQRLYHPWQISAIHFAEKRLVVALTDGTISIWE
jgi:curved DNA-binding protein CbpA